MKDGNSKSIDVALEGGETVELVTAKVEDMSMPSYPPPPESSTNDVHNASSDIEPSMLNGAVARVGRLYVSVDISGTRDTSKLRRK